MSTEREERETTYKKRKGSIDENDMDAFSPIAACGDINLIVPCSTFISRWFRFVSRALYAMTRGLRICHEEIDVVK